MVKFCKNSTLCVLLISIVAIYICYFYMYLIINEFPHIEGEVSSLIHDPKNYYSTHLRPHAHDNSNPSTIFYPQNQNENENQNKDVIEQQKHTITSITTDTQPPIEEVKEEEIKKNSIQKKKVAYAITITKDGPFTDGALVLGYAARRIHGLVNMNNINIHKNNPDTALPRPGNSEYDVELVAFMKSNVVKSRQILSQYGWKIIERPLPVELDEIENTQYMEKMKNSGCCGADEFLKLWAYTLTSYDRVIHLDMDSIVYQNMDELYNQPYELQYTGDYNMATRPVPPVQGGFLVIKPSLERFEELRSIIRKGQYSGGSGWESSHIGKFWGGATIQGIMPYFYARVHEGDAKELNRCIYNVMVDNPYRPYRNENDVKKCLNGQPTCEDCRKQSIEKVKSAHFTICQKPWTCTKHDNPRNKDLCEKLHAQWFQLRDEFEQEQQISNEYRATKTRFRDSLGMCAGYGSNKYKPIPVSV